MSENYLTTDGYRPARKPNPTAFLILVILAAAICGLAVYMGNAPIKSLFPEDWIGWGRTSVNWAIALGAGALVGLVSMIGLLVTLGRLLMTLGHPKKLATSYLSPDQRTADFRPTTAADHFPDPDLAPFPAVNTAPLAPLAATSLTSVPLASALATTSAPHAAETPVTVPVVTVIPAAAPEPEAPEIEAAAPQALELESLEPAVFPDPATFSDPRIFSDNASDSFLTRPVENPTITAFDSAAALSDTHGLHVGAHNLVPTVETPHSEPVTAELPTAQIIQLHPDVALADVTPPSDPLEAALLADGPAVSPRHVPPSDMNAVITSAMSFIAPVAATSVAVPAAEKIYESLPGGADTAFVPVAVASEPAIRIVEDHPSDVAPHDTRATETHADAHPVSQFPIVAAPIAEMPVTEVHAVEAAPTPVAEPVATPAFDHEAEIRQVSQTVLSVWPDATRAIAADELGLRLTRLYHDPAPESQKAFKLLGSGDLSAATSTIAAHADTLDAAAANSEAAEMWRIYGALHMGRDDPKALLAYEHVSELDPSDANIHVYLARRYQMAGDTVKQPAVISRALAVVTDPATRAEFLPTFADLKLKAGDHKAAGDALEELSRLQETATYLKPDDVAAKSAYAITVARLAQTREMSGQYAEASPMYMKAYQAFSLLSKEKPDHAGLKAMAENALKDYNRLTQTA